MLFHRLFLLDPSLLHFFSFTSNFDVHQLSKDLDTPNEELFKNAEFVEHAKIVVGAVDMLVKNVGWGVGEGRGGGRSVSDSYDGNINIPYEIGCFICDLH